MEPILFVRTAAVLLAITAVGGLAMAAIRFSGDKQPPAWLAMVHGLLVAAAITLLIFGAATVGLPNFTLTALILFLITAAGGAYLNLNYQWKQVLLPKALVIGHAVMAVVGFVLLLIVRYGSKCTPSQNLRQSYERCGNTALRTRNGRPETNRRRPPRRSTTSRASPATPDQRIPRRATGEATLRAGRDDVSPAQSRARGSGASDPA